MSKIIQSGWFFGFWLANLGKKALTSVAISLTRDNSLSGLVSNLASNSINKFERKISGKVAGRAGTGFTFLILNENMNYIIRIKKSLEGLRVLIDGVIETVKHEINRKADFL